MKYITTIDNREYTIEILDSGLISVDGKKLRVDFVSISDEPVYSLLIEGKSHEAYVYPMDDAWQVLLDGTSYPVQVEDEVQRRLRASYSTEAQYNVEYNLKAPMPGLVVAVPVIEGQEVEKGDVLLILESMKMQNELKSPRPGKVTDIKVKAGDRVEQRQVMLNVV